MTLKKQITFLRIRVELSENENDGFINKLEKLGTNDDNSDWRRDVDTELTNLKKHFARKLRSH